MHTFYYSNLYSCSIKPAVIGV